jgi:ABC-type Zn uptake system ZnuABC Zn-binding protein ZnuA
VTGCSGAGREDSPASRTAAIADRPIRVTTTVGMIADVVRNVGGDGRW